MGSLRRGDGMTLILTISRRRDNLDCRNHSDHLPACVSAEDEDAASPSLRKQEDAAGASHSSCCSPELLRGDHPSFLSAAGRLCQWQLAPLWALKAPRGPLRPSETRTVPLPARRRGRLYWSSPSASARLPDQWMDGSSNLLRRN